jgi:hypothetical protein
MVKNDSLLNWENKNKCQEALVLGFSGSCDRHTLGREREREDPESYAYGIVARTTSSLGE